MSAIKRPASRLPDRARQRGVAAVEFSIVAFVFLMLLFGIIEFARAMYICNTLQEVTRRGAALAANTDFSDTSAMDNVRVRAVFRDNPGLLMFAAPISDKNIQIDYLQIPLNVNVPVSMGSSLPSSPAENRLNCTNDLYGSNCIRLVRVRVCKEGGSGSVCERVPYQTLISLIPFVFHLPSATTIATIETLGMAPGTPSACGC